MSTRVCEVIKKRSCILSQKLSEVCVVFYEIPQNDVKKPKISCMTKNEWFNKQAHTSEINVDSVDSATLLVADYMEIFIPS